MLANGYVHSPVLIPDTRPEGGYDFTLNFSTVGQLRGAGRVSGDTRGDDRGGGRSEWRDFAAGCDGEATRDQDGVAEASGAGAGDRSSGAEAYGELNRN